MLPEGSLIYKKIVHPKPDTYEKKTWLQIKHILALKIIKSDWCGAIFKCSEANPVDTFDWSRKLALISIFRSAD